MNRREFLGAAVACAAGVPLSRAATADGAKKSISGRVHDDKGKPMAGVVVTDGLFCVRTGTDGKFAFKPREKARFVSVTVPSGWATDCSFVEIPAKSDWYDFELRPSALSAGKGCTFVHISDSEVASVRTNGWDAHVRDVAAAEKAAFIVHTGDICNRRGMVAHQKFMNEVTMGRPVVYVIGNHDYEPGPTGEGVFESLFGPIWHSFEAGGIHFCVTPMYYGDYRFSYTLDEVADWLRNDLALVPKGMPVVVFSHMLSNDTEGFAAAGQTYGKKRRIRFDDVCNFTGFVYGHTHQNRFRRDGKVAFVCTDRPNDGGVGLMPPSVRAIHVAPDGRLTSTLYFGNKSPWTAAKGGSVWETDLGAPFLGGEPVVAGGRVFVGLSDEDGLGTGGVSAFDTKDGRLLWTAPMPGSVTNRIVHHRGTVVVQDCEGRVAAFAAADGRVLWRVDLGGMVRHRILGGLALDAANGRVFAANGTRFSALDVATGEIVWKVSGWSGEDVNLNSFTPGFGEGVVLRSDYFGGLYAVDAKTGRMLWHRKDGKANEFDFMLAIPSVRDGKVLAVGYHTCLELDAKTGETIRSKRLAARMDLQTSVVATDRHLLFGTVGDGLIALDRETLEIAWKGKVGEGWASVAPYSYNPQHCVPSVPVLLPGGRVAATSTDGAVHVWREADGRELKAFSNGVPYVSGCTYADGRIYAADLNGTLRAFAL